MLVLSSAAFVLMWLVIAARLVARHRRLTRFDALLVVFAVGASMDSLSAVAGVWVLPWPLVHAVFITSCVVGLGLSVETVRVATRGEPYVRRRPAVALVAAVTVALVTAAIGGRPQGPLPMPSWEIPAAGGVFWVGYAVVQVSACAVMLAMVVPFARQFDSSPLRQAAWIITACLVVGVLYGVGLFLIAVAIVGRGSGDLAATLYAWGSLNYVLLAAAYLRLWWARHGSRGRHTRTLALLRPLWDRLHEVDPDLTLVGLPQRSKALSRHDLSLLVVRAVLEIRDWTNVLARRLPAGADRRAAEAAAVLAANGQERAALATAGWLAAALHSQTQHDDHSAWPVFGADVDDDLRLLEQAATMMDSPQAAAVTAAVLSAEPVEHGRQVLQD